MKCPANSGGCDTPPTNAADDGLVSVCRLLLEHNAIVTFKCMNDEPDGHAFTPLLYAAKNAAHNTGQRNQSDLCQLLLQYGADFNAQDAKGLTPLMWTAPAKGNTTGQLEFARILLQFGASVRCGGPANIAKGCTMKTAATSLVTSIQMLCHRVLHSF